MGDPAVTPKERFTYRHYKSWPDSESWELIDGQAWNMSPAPSRRHQKISGRLFTRLSIFLEGKTCEAYEAPFDVLLPDENEPDEEVATVVQPDIVVFCDRSKLRDYGARGAPDLVVEILSPSTSRKDQKEKFDLYERHGVREFWVIDPWAWSVWAYRLRPDGRFDEGELKERLRDRSSIVSTAIDGFIVNCEELFADLD